MMLDKEAPRAGEPIGLLGNNTDQQLFAGQVSTRGKLEVILSTKAGPGVTAHQCRRGFDEMLG